MPIPREEFSTKTRRAAKERAGVRCEWTREGFRCEAILGPGNCEYDHVIPFAISQDSSLENCQVLCRPHHDIKTFDEDIPTIAKGKRIADKHMNIRKPSTLPVRGFARIEREPKRLSAEKRCAGPTAFARQIVEISK